MTSLEEHGVRIEHHFGGGVYAKETVIPAGKVLTQHRHQHDHLSILARGTARLRVDGVARLLTGPACIVIEAGKVHEVEAISAVTWFCIHATDCTDPAQVDHELIEEV